MNRFYTLSLVLIFVVVWAVSTLVRGGDQQQTTGLAGARAVIDAAEYPDLQAALDALPEEGGLVRLPPGEFEIVEPLFVRAGDVCLEGAGTATHIKNINETGQPALVLEHPAGSQDRKHELWRIRLANFRITGNPKSGHGIEARRINEVFIDGVTVSYHGGDGIRLEQCYEDPRICDSLITYNKATGLNLLGCHDIVVSANQFEENQDAVRCIDGFNLTMTGNALDDHLGDGVVIENTYGSVVSANMIEECHGAAIVLDRDCYGNAVSANVIAHNGQGVVLRDAHGCAISANTFTIMKADALYVGPASGRIAAVGNSFSNSFIGDGQVKRGTDDLEAAGVVLDGAADVNLAGNVFSSVRPMAVSIPKPCNRVLISGSVFTDVASEHDQADKLTNSVIDGNLSAD